MQKRKFDPLSAILRERDERASIHRNDAAKSTTVDVEFTSETLSS